MNAPLTPKNIFATIEANGKAERKTRQRASQAAGRRHTADERGTRPLSVRIRTVHGTLPLVHGVSGRRQVRRHRSGQVHAPSQGTRRVSRPSASGSRLLAQEASGAAG